MAINIQILPSHTLSQLPVKRQLTFMTCFLMQLKAWLLVGGFFWAVIATFQKSTAADDQITIILPLMDEHYDASPLITKFRSIKTDSHQAQWYPWNLQVRLGLVLLKTQGKLHDFEVTPEHVSLTFTADAFEPIKRLLSPPRLLNLEQISGQSKIIVYVHGLEGGPTTFLPLANALERDGWFPLRMVFANDGPVEPPAEFLTEQLVKIHRSWPHSRIVVVAHSFGGIIAWKAIADAGSVGVTDFVALGVPFKGSSLAKFQAELEWIDVMLLASRGNLKAMDIISDGDGEAVEVLLPDSPLRNAILSTPLPSTIKLHLVAGSRAPFESDELARVSPMLEQWIEKRRPSDSLADDLRYILKTPEIATGAGDGAVTIHSATNVETWSSKRIFDRSHSGLLKIDGQDDELLQWIREQIDGR